MRRVAGALVLLGLVACGRGVPVATGTAPPRAGAPATATATTAAPSPPSRVAPAARTRAALSPTEPAPEAKALASRVATELTTYGPADSPASVAGRVTADPARRAALASAARPLWHEGRRSEGSVVYPQLGGLTADRVSVMVVVRQAVEGRPAHTRVLDVRLVRGSGGWAFDALASAGGTPVARPATLPAEARAVLDDPRITLPDSARWDIHSGTVAPALLRAMAALAERTPYAVAVLESGHPHDVFGTTRTSAHTVGRAVDVYALRGLAVAEQQRAGSAAYDLTRWLLGRPGVRQVGSPWDVDGASRRSFTDTVHLDHLHVAV